MIEDTVQTLTRIIQNAAFASSPEEQVQMIVDAVSDAIAVDVCSLYRQGQNDLSQYLLAVDRNNPLVAHYHDPLHPAMIHELMWIINHARRCQLPVSVCGEMSSDPVAVMLLLAMGVRKLSMSSAKLPMIKWLIRSVTLAETEKYLQAVLKLDNATSIRALGKEIMDNNGIYQSGLRLV